MLQYEPYYSTSFTYDVAEQAAHKGVSASIYYDALDRVHRTELPDGTFSYTTWDSWSQKVYDPNDTVLDSQWYADRTGSGPLAGDADEADAAAKAAEHAATPALMYLDSLARPFYTVQHNKAPDSGGVWQDAFIHSYATLSIEGNRLEVHALRTISSVLTDVVPISYVYNMLQQGCYQSSMDSSDGYGLVDVGGQPLYGWDTEDRRVRMRYDALRRPFRQEMDEPDGSGGWTNLKCLSTITYGEGVGGSADVTLLS